jgi:hypothetical protein
MMTRGAALCMLQRHQGCEEAFQQVVVFRENAQYDSRLPRRPRAVFEEVRDETVQGQRGSMRVVTEPPGAEVFVDGRFVGASPARAESLLAGNHYVTLKLVGYPRTVRRMAVHTDFENTETFDLLPLENGPLLHEALAAVREEVGHPQTGPGMRDLWSLLLVDQLVLGQLRRLGTGDMFELRLFVYDLRTNNRLYAGEHRINWGVLDLSLIEHLLTDVYESVDLSGQLRPPERQADGEGARGDEPLTRKPFHRTWWFWTIIGAVVVGTTVGLSVGLTQQTSDDDGSTLTIPF